MRGRWQQAWAGRERVWVVMMADRGILFGSQHPARRREDRRTSAWGKGRAEQGSSRQFVGGIATPHLEGGPAEPPAPLTSDCAFMMSLDPVVMPSPSLRRLPTYAVRHRFSFATRLTPVSMGIPSVIWLEDGNGRPRATNLL